MLWDRQGDYSTTVFSERAVDVINEHDTSEPLFLYLAYQAVHSPDEVPDQYVEPYKKTIPNDTKRQTFAGMLTCMDEGVGNVTAALKAKGMLDNTLIIVQADNGGPIEGTSRCHICGDHTGTSNYPLRGGKHSLWVGGTLASSIAWASPSSGILPPSANGTHLGYNLMHVVDWQPTLLRFAGMSQQDVAALAKAEGWDGMDQYEALLGQAASPRDEIILNYDSLHNIESPLKPGGAGNAALRLGEFVLLVGDPGPPDCYSPANASGPCTPAEYSTPTGETRPATIAELTAKLLPLAARSPTALSEQEMEGLRAMAQGFRGDFAVQNTTMQLFNLTADPYQRNDLSRTLPSVVAKLSARVNYWGGLEQPADFCFPGTQSTRCDNPNANPKLYNNTWTPWLPNPAAGSAEADGTVLPPMTHAEVDALLRAHGIVDDGAWRDSLQFGFD